MVCKIKNAKIYRLMMTGVLCGIFVGMHLSTVLLAEEQWSVNASMHTVVFSYHQMSLFHPAKNNFREGYFGVKVGVQPSNEEAIHIRYSSLEFHTATNLTLEQTYHKEQSPVPAMKIYTQIDSITSNAISIDYSRLLFESEILRIDVGFGPLLNIMKSQNKVNTSTYYAYGIMAAFGMTMHTIDIPFAFCANVEMHHAFHHRKSALDYYGGFLVSVGIGVIL